ncbi:MAG: MarR family winged helix-turn-helix transcriptional regulator [Pseudomonadota bacterium]
MTVKSPDPDTPLIELERFLPYRLNVVAEAVSRALSELYDARHGISIPEWRVIATLGQYRRMTAKDIGAHSRMHKTKVSRAVARLMERGCLARSSNSADKREAFLELTGSGRAIYDDLVPRALAFETALADRLSESERKALETILDKLEGPAQPDGRDNT